MRPPLANVKVIRSFRTNFCTVTRLYKGKIGENVLTQEAFAGNGGNQSAVAPTGTRGGACGPRKLFAFVSVITLDEKLSVVLSKRLRSFFPQPALEQNFVPFEGKAIHLPEKLAEPDMDFLRFHREEIFQS